MIGKRKIFTTFWVQYQFSHFPNQDRFPHRPNARGLSRVEPADDRKPITKFEKLRNKNAKKHALNQHNTTTCNT